MTNKSLDDTSLFERFLISAHPLVKRLCKLLRAEGSDLTPYPSAMLDNLNWLHEILFRRIRNNLRFDKDSLFQLKISAENSTIVYIAKYIDQLEYNQLSELFRTNNIPLVEYTNAVTMRRWMYWRDCWNSIAKQSDEIEKFGCPNNPIADNLLPNLIASGKNILLTIPESELLDDRMFYSCHVRQLASIFDAQKNTDKKITIVPIDFVWNRKIENEAKSTLDILFGDKESPGRIRKTIMFWRKYSRKSELIIGAPIAISDYTQSPNEDSIKLAAKLRGSLMAAFHARRHVLTGPPTRPGRWFVREITGNEALDTYICQMAAVRGKPADDLRMLAHKYAKEIVANIDNTYIELLDKILSRVFKHLYETVDVDMGGLAKAKELNSEGPVVFVPNHKSHMDYLILSHVLYHNGMTIPHIAAGINLEFWPVGNIFRHCGAYFIRRAFRNNELYKAVLETYLKILLREGYSQEFFIEGGRSRTGKLLKPKTGMLSMLHKAAKTANVENLKFIPVSITYDRVIEQKSYVQELEGANKETERTSHLLKLVKYLKSHKHRYGSIYIRFGEALPPANNFDDGVAMNDIAQKICHRINHNIVATPAAIAAAAILASGKRGVLMNEAARNWHQLISYLKTKNVEFSPHIKHNRPSILNEALNQFENTKLISLRPNSIESFISIDESKRLPISYFRNSIVHFFVSISVVCTLLKKPGALASITDNFVTCRDILSHEFKFATRLSVEDHIIKAIDYLTQQNVIIRSSSSISISPENIWILDLFAAQIRPFVETLWVTIRFIDERMTKPMDDRALVSELMHTGHELFLLEQVRYKDAITKVGLENALKALVSYKVLQVEESVGSSFKRRKIYHKSEGSNAIQNLKAALQLLV